MADPTYTVGVEFVSGSFTNLSSYCLQASVERQLSTLFNPPREGVALFTLANDDARFSPQNSASPYYPNVVPGKSVKLEATHRENYLSCPGSNSNRATASVSASDLRSAFTVMARVNVDTISDLTQGFVDKTVGSATNTQWLLYGESNAFSFRGVDSGGTLFTARSTSAAWTNANNLWTHVAGRYDGSNLEVYVNGLVSGSPVAVAAPLKGGAGALVVSQLGLTPNYAAVGKLKDIRLYNRALSSAELLSCFSGNIVDQTALVSILNPDDALSGSTTIRSKLTGETWTLIQSSSPVIEILTENSSVFALFTGRTVNLELAPAVGEKTVLMEAADSINRLANVYATTSLFVGTNARSLFTSLASLSALNSFSVDSDIADSISFAWFNDEPIAEAVQRLSEFGNYQLYEDGAGTLRLKSRYFRQGDSSVATYSANSGFASMALSFGQESVRNQVKLSGQPRKQSGSVNTVAWLNETLSIPASSGIGFFLDYVDPVEPTQNAPATNLVVPVQSSDWLLNTVSGGGGSDVTSNGSLQITFFGESAVCSIYNGTGQNAYVTKFQIRGNSIQLQPELSFETGNSSSQNVYGKRVLSLENDLLALQTYIEGYGTYLLDIKREPQPDLSFSLTNEFPDVLAREVGDVVSLVESLSAVNSQWQIVGVQHEISLVNGLEHNATFSVRYWADYNWLVLDHTTRGKLDNAKLGF